MTHDEMIAVVKAHKEGKEIQYKGASGIFEKMPWDWSFNFASYTYRIKPESTREEITAKWVKDNDVKVDATKVIVSKKDHIRYGEIGFVDQIKDTYVSVMFSNGYTYFHVEHLQKVTQKLVPFTFEDREEFRDKWVKGKLGTVEYLITLIRPSGIGFIDVDGCISFIDYEKALKRIEFIDGRPFGKEIWE